MPPNYVCRKKKIRRCEYYAVFNSKTVINPDCVGFDDNNSCCHMDLSMFKFWNVELYLYHLLRQPTNTVIWAWFIGSFFIPG